MMLTFASAFSVSQGFATGETTRSVAEATADWEGVPILIKKLGGF